MWSVVVGVGFPAAFRNRTALALCVAWLVPEVIYFFLDTNLPLMLYFIFDYLVIIVMFTKPDLCDLSPYTSLGAQFRALWFERCRTDFIVGAIFPVMWLIYIVRIDDFYKWWTLWGLVLVQFFVSGWEAFCLWRVDRQKAQARETSGIFRLGLVGNA